MRAQKDCRGTLHGLYCSSVLQSLSVQACLIMLIWVSHSVPVSSVKSSVDSQNLLRGQWTVWKKQHNKVYRNYDEESKRFAAWVDNYAFIEEHNKHKEAYGYSLGMNVFGDETFQDWSDLYKCHNQYSGTHDKNLVTTFSHGVLAKNLREDFIDWRERGVVTKVKNQEDYRCHSCYAFAATGSLEGAHAISSRNLVSLSEQQILDCSKVYGNAGCQGGNYLSTWEYIIKNGGIDTSTYYPYRSEGGFCQYSKDYLGATMSSAKIIERGNEEALAEAVQIMGPVTVAIHHLRRPFQFYSEGIYKDVSCSSNPKNATHEMVVVGYGTDSSYGPYWILKNSYGTTWGENGYMLMLRGVNTCGVASDAGFPIV